MNLSFDIYTLRARLQPALLVLLPLALTAIAWTPLDKLLIGSAWTLLGMTGFTFLLAQVARDSGKKLEPELWRSWGGAPTTIRLRHSTAPNRVLLARYRAALEEILGSRLPNELEERDSLEAADAVYEAATAALRTRTRDEKAYPLVFKELVNYGFRRNLLGMRPAGVLLSLIGIAAACAAAFAADAQFHVVAPCVLLNILMFVWWSFRINADWVKPCAFAYADRLLEASENIADSLLKGVPR
jgi:hypothetical protein